MFFNHCFWRHLYQSVFSTWPKNQDKNLNTWKRKELFRWNKKYFSSFSKCLHKLFHLDWHWNTETASLTMLAIKRGLLCNFTKHLKGCHCIWHSGRSLKLKLLLTSKSSKLSLHSLLKNMSKIAILDLCVSEFWYHNVWHPNCNILLLEMHFDNLQSNVFWSCDM